MAKLGNYPSGAVESGDYFIGATQKGKTKRITMSSVVALAKESINTLDNFAVTNKDNGYTLSWNSNILSIDGPSIEDAILSVSGANPIESITTNRNTTLSLKYEGAGNIVDAAKKYNTSVNNVQFLVQDKLNGAVGKLGISKLPYTNNEGTVKSISITDGNGHQATITDEGSINIVGGNGISTEMVGSDLVVKYLGKVGGTVSKVKSLDETVILASVSADGSEITIRPAKMPGVRPGRYDFASVTIDNYGRITKIEDQKNKIDALTARIEQLESQIQSQDESSTSTSD
jgi:hypothetical protein